MKQLEHTFNSVVDIYDKWRPNYIDELYNDILNYQNLDDQSSVLEIGIGTGQATLPFLKRNCKVTAVELGSDLAKFVKEKYKSYENLEVLNNSFQDLKSKEGKYDLIYSATAFHWIPEEIGYKKVHQLLKNKGAFARFANRPYKDKGNPDLDEAIQAVYSRFKPPTKLRAEFSLEDSKNIADIALKYNFSDIKYYTYPRVRVFNAKGYASLISTYSDIISMDQISREKFLIQIMEVINEFGGKISVYDTLDLQLARK